MTAAEKSAEGIVGGAESAEGPNGWKWQVERRSRAGQAAENPAGAGLRTGAKGEARSAAEEGTEAGAANAGLESPAAAGPSMEAIVERDNLRKALAQVRRNKGAPGVDGMTVDELASHLKEHWPAIRAQLLDGTYQPQPVRRVEIPKATGGTRAARHPDGARPLHPAGGAAGAASGVGPDVLRAQLRLPAGALGASGGGAGAGVHRAGHGVVVDIDLEKFFDRVNHDILMGLVAKRVADKRMLKLIRGFLTAGVLKDGLVGPTEEGTPQGGPLSPLLSNLMLDELDRELEKRGHRFVRYADDCNIYVRSRRAGERVMASVERFLDQASQAQGQRGEERGGPPVRAEVPGLQLHERASSRSGASRRRRWPGSKRVRELTRRTPGQSLAQMVEELSALPDRVARLLRLLRDAIGAARPGPVDQAAAARRRLEAVEARADALCANCANAASGRTWRPKPPAARTARGGSATAPP